MGNNSDESVIELGGYEFKKVKDGLDEAQVTSSINELISQRDEFMRHEKHLSSLTKLAERTISEADKLAEEIKTKAKDQAQAEVSAIIATGEEQAQRINEEKRNEIINTATEQAEAIKAEAEREAKLLRESKKRSIQSELRGSVHQLYDQLISEFENLKQQTAKLKVEFEDKLSQFSEETDLVSVEQDEKHDESMELILGDVD